MCRYQRTAYLIQGSYGQGKPENFREFQNFSKVREKLGNFKITQKLEKIIKIFENIQRSGNFQNYPEKQENCI